MTKREDAVGREIVEISDYLLALYACTRNPAIPSVFTVQLNI
jgi:hypothetical protein